MSTGTPLPPVTDVMRSMIGAMDNDKRPPSDACCGSCFWGRVLMDQRVKDIEGRQMREDRPVLYCCHARPRIEAMADTVCPDWDEKRAADQ